MRIIQTTRTAVLRTLGGLLPGTLRSMAQLLPSVCQCTAGPPCPHAREPGLKQCTVQHTGSYGPGADGTLFQTGYLLICNPHSGVLFSEETLLFALAVHCV